MNLNKQELTSISLNVPRFLLDRIKERVYDVLTKDIVEDIPSKMEIEVMTFATLQEIFIIEGSEGIYKVIPHIKDLLPPITKETKSFFKDVLLTINKLTLRCEKKNKQTKTEVIVKV